MRKDWEVKKLGDVCDIFDYLRRPITKSERISGDYPYYGASGVQDYVDSFIFDGRYLLVGEDGAKWGKKEISSYIIEGKSWVNNHVHVLRLNESLIDSFVEYYLNYSDLTKYITGAVVPKLTQRALQSIIIPVPPLQTQHQVVEELNCLTSIIEKQKKQLEELDNLAQAIFYDMFGNPIDNEKGWPTLSFGNLFLLRSGNSLPAKKQIPGDFKVYGGNGINGTHVEFNREGEFIIIGRVGAYCGNVRIVKGAFWLTDNAFELKQIKEIQDTIYLLFLLRFINLFKYANKAAQPVISNTVLRDIMIPLPPLPLQQQFASKIEAIEKQKELIKKSIKETEGLFNSRMDYYFN